MLRCRGSDKINISISRIEEMQESVMSRKEVLAKRKRDSSYKAGEQRRSRRHWSVYKRALLALSGLIWFGDGVHGYGMVFSVWKGKCAFFCQQSKPYPSHSLIEMLFAFSLFRCSSV